MNEYGLFNLISATYKDYVEKKELDKIRCEFLRLQEADADARRSRAQVQIEQMAKLKNELKHFEYTYSQFVKNTGITIPRIEKYMKEITQQIKLISFQKNQ